MTYSLKEYFSDWSNYIDMLFLLSMTCYIVINFALQFDNSFNVRMFGAITLIFSWIKIITYLRALSGFAFIMLMLIAVFNDMKYFLFILIWILLGFSLSCKFCFLNKIKSWDALIKKLRVNIRHIPYDKNLT